MSENKPFSALWVYPRKDLGKTYRGVKNILEGFIKAGCPEGSTLKVIDGESLKLEEENKSLRTSIMDLQETLELYDDRYSLKWSRQALDRLKAAGNYVEGE